MIDHFFVHFLSEGEPFLVDQLRKQLGVVLDIEARLVVSVLESMIAMWTARDSLFHVVLVEGFHVFFNQKLEQTLFAHAVDFASATVFFVA